MKRRLLVVEDTRVLAENIADLFRMEGYEVDVSENGEEGLLRLKRTFYDLVITDLIMPVMDGETLINEIRAIALQIPVIVLTARHLDLAQEQNLKSAGVDLILNKTVEIDLLLDYVSKFVGRNDE
jgi:CheY-like chemotaxis protein